MLTQTTRAKTEARTALSSDKAAFAVEFIDIEKASEIEGVTWEDFQIDFLNDTSRLRIDTKARQISWSFTAALDAVVDGILHEGTPHIFTSVNLAEAKEKNRYARRIIDAIDSPARPRIERDSLTTIELANGSRLISFPCRPIRGPARARIYMDEIAHYPRGLDKDIYAASLPATIKGDGYIRMGSSPLGAHGLFWEIAQEEMRPFPGFTRRRWPWWMIKALCLDVASASKYAPAMDTKQRVALFGTPALQEIFANMFAEDFQQEYECAYVDEATAWINWEVIKRNQDPDLICYRASSVDEALALIPQLREQIKKGQLETSFAAGLDVGRKRDLTEFFMVGRTTDERAPLRLTVSLASVEYEQQEACIEKLLKALPVTLCYIDENGIGAMLAENLSKRTVAEGFAFTNPSKELLAVTARVEAEAGRTPLPVDREIAYQLHSIKKKYTETAKAQFDSDRSEKHHADKFWAWALALLASQDIAKGWLISS